MTLNSRSISQRGYGFDSWAISTRGYFTVDADAALVGSGAAGLSVVLAASASLGDVLAGAAALSVGLGAAVVLADVLDAVLTVRRVEVSGAASMAPTLDGDAAVSLAAAAASTMAPALDGSADVDATIGGASDVDAAIEGSAVVGETIRASVEIEPE